MKTITISDDAASWLRYGKRGISSEAIFSQLTGLEMIAGRWSSDHPHDPSDLVRCRLLLADVPEFASRLDEMRTRSKIWARFCDHWDELCSLMDSECPEWPDGTGKAPKTFELMRKICE